MWRKDFSKLSTLAVQTEYVYGMQKYERLCGATLMERPSWWILKWQKPRALWVNGELAAILARRYEACLNEMLHCCSVSEREWAEAMDRIWFVMGAQTLTMRRHHGFAPLLWDVFEAQFEIPQKMKVFRPKFMLRQFIEELPDSDARGTLLLCAYDKGAAQIARSALTLEKLQDAYELLHKVLVRYQDQLYALTGGTIAPLNLDPELGTYDNWMFPDED